MSFSVRFKSNLLLARVLKKQIDLLAPESKHLVCFIFRLLWSLHLVHIRSIKLIQEINPTNAGVTVYM